MPGGSQELARSAAAQPRCWHAPLPGSCVPQGRRETVVAVALMVPVASGWGQRWLREPWDAPCGWCFGTQCSRGQGLGRPSAEPLRAGGEPLRGQEARALLPLAGCPRVGTVGLCPKGISSSLSPGWGLAARASSRSTGAMGEDRAWPGRAGSERSRGGGRGPLPHLVSLHFRLAIVSFDLENKPDFVSGFYFK